MENSVLTVKKPANPWGTSLKTAPCSLMSVMDEELAKEIGKNESFSTSAIETALDKPFDTSVEGTLEDRLYIPGLQQDLFVKESFNVALGVKYMIKLTP